VGSKSGEDSGGRDSTHVSGALGSKSSPLNCSWCFCVAMPKAEGAAVLVVGKQVM
jgi:hypothetical protein